MHGRPPTVPTHFPQCPDLKILCSKSPWKQLQGDSGRKHSGNIQTARNTLRTAPYPKVQHSPLRLTLSAKHRHANRTFKTRVQNHFHGLPVLRNGEMSENDKKTKKVLKRSQAQKVFRTKGSNRNDAGTKVLKINKAKPVKVKNEVKIHRVSLSACSSNSRQRNFLLLSLKTNRRSPKTTSENGE